MYRTRCSHLGADGLLRVLEETARKPNIHLKDFSEVYRKERWFANRNSALLSSKSPTSDPTMISRIMASAFETDTLVSILTPLLNVALELQTEHMHFIHIITAKLARGIESLPDELLPSIFSFAVQGEGQGGGKQAVRLSHVSRRFRSIALAERTLWTTLSLHLPLSLEGLEIFISRSGKDTLFDVYVDIDPDRFFLPDYQIMNILGPTTPRWRKLEVTERPRRWYNDELDGLRRVYASHFFGTYFGGENEGLYAATNLAELTIHAESSISTGDLCVSKLAIPSLRSLRCSKHIPSPSTTFNSVTKISFCVSFSEYQNRHPVAMLLEFLSTMPSLGDLELDLHGADEVSIDGSWNLPPSLCPDVTSFRFRIPSLYISREWHQSGFIKLFLRSLHLPRLEEFTIDIIFRESCDSQSECAQKFSDLSTALLTFHASYPRRKLSSLVYNITYDPFTYRSKPPSSLESFPKIFPIPLDKIPNVSTVTITTCTQVRFTQEGPSVAVGDGIRSGLRDIQFVRCKEMEIEHLRFAIQSLKDLGAWEVIQRVVIDDCPSIKLDDALEVIGKERLCMDSSDGSSPPPNARLLRQSAALAEETKASAALIESKKPVVKDDHAFKVQERKARKTKTKARAPAPVISSNRFEMLEDGGG